ncbi:MAG: hypothetical protein HRT44_01885 [Bdellovibrionales bacterium]|nr:hypothetical protein [Bdellovibrionales bacterium]
MTLFLPSMGWANSCSEVFKKYDSQFYSFDEVTRQQAEWRENSSGYPNINFSKIDIRPPRSNGEKEVFLDLSIRQRVNTGLNNGETNASVFSVKRISDYQFNQRDSISVINQRDSQALYIAELSSGQVVLVGPS